MIALSRKKVWAIAIAVVLAIALAVTLPFAFMGSATGTTDEGFTITGNVTIAKNGDVVFEGSNMVVNVGVQSIGYYVGYGGKISTLAVSAFNEIGIGEGDTSGICDCDYGYCTAPACTDTDLESQIGTRKAASFVDGTAASCSYTWLLTTSFDGATYAGKICECAVFNASTGGDMLCRQRFPQINLQGGDTLTVTWTFTVS